MPETWWTIRWPDGAEERCYSPSSVVADIFTPGETYPLAEFRQKARAAMEQASDRVAARYGYACTSAMAQLDRIETQAARFEADADASVACIAIAR